MAKKSAKKTGAKKPAAAKKVAKKIAKIAKKAVKASSKSAKQPAKKATKKAIKKAATKPVKKTATQAKKATKATPVSKKSARKAAPEASKTESKNLVGTVTKLGGKGVLIRLKRPPEEKAKAEAAVAAARSYTEKSNGQNPVTLHHRKPTKQEMAEFLELLLSRRKQLMGDMKGLEAEAFSDETQVVSTNHLADSSFEQYEQEFTLSMIENEADELREIGRALDKIEEGTFGVCESCGIDISIERLRVMPYTRVCIHCRTKFEEEGTGREFGIVPERRV